MATKNSWNSNIPVQEALGGTDQTTYTKGDIIYASGTDAASKLAIGTDDFISYVSTDVPAYANGTPGQKILIGSQTASATATLDFESLIDSSKYLYYEFIGLALQSSVNSRKFTMRWSIDNGSTYITANYNWVYRRDVTGSSDRTASTSSSHLQFNDLSGNSATQGNSFHLTFYPSAAPGTTYNMFCSKMSFRDSTSRQKVQQGAGLSTTTSEVTAIQFKYHVGSVSTGTIHMYGIVK